MAIAETLTVEDQPRGEIQIVPNGVNPSPNWGLDKIGESQNDGNAYTYPDTIHPVRLYLIDTAVKIDPGNWMEQNPKLTFEGTQLIRSGSDPATSSQFGHGTRMLSLVAGLQTGVAPGTPIRVKNYDVYPAGTTTATKISSAVWDAIAHYQDSNPRIPSVICIASSASIPGTSTSLQASIQAAIAEGLTVVVSAGNLGQNAADYIPAAYGTMDGVICVGASDSANQRITTSNSGAPVDLLAPGEVIKVITEAGTNDLMTGTSPAAALVAGSALAELSMNGSLTPAQVEERLIASAAASATPGAPPVLRTTSLAAANIAFPDGPITSSPIPLACQNFPSNESLAALSEAAAGSSSQPETESTALNEFHGVSENCKAECSIAVPSGNEMEFTFPIDFDLLDPADLFTLRNGYAWRIRSSENLDSWEVPEGSLSKQTAPDGTVLLTAKIPVSKPSGFLRIEVVEAP